MENIKTQEDGSITTLSRLLTRANGATCTGPPPGLQAVLLVSRPSILTTQILPDLSDAQKLHKYPSPPRNNVRTSHYLCLRSRKQYRMLHVCNAKHCDTAV